MQNCNICDAKIGNTIVTDYDSPEKTWLAITPCCMKTICFRCLLKSKDIECQLCNGNMLTSLPQSISQLTNMKLYPTQTINVSK